MSKRHFTGLELTMHLANKRAHERSKVHLPGKRRAILRKTRRAEREAQAVRDEAFLKESTLRMIRPIVV